MHPSPGKRARDTSRLSQLAERQHGVIAGWQLDPLGITDSALHRRLRAGHLHRLHRGVYALGHRKLTTRGRWLAAVLACGPLAALSHVAAAALWGLRQPPPGPIDVTAPVKHRQRGIRAHTSRSMSPEDMTTIDGIPVTSLERTVLDQAAVLSHQRLRSMLENLQRRELLDATRLRSVLDRNRGHRGHKRLATALEALHDEAPFTQSEAERRFLELIRAAGLPEPQVNVLVAGELVDFYWPEHKLVIEIDGYGFHRSRRSFESDRRRDIKLGLVGCRTARITPSRIANEPQRLVSEVAGLLGCGGL